MLIKAEILCENRASSTKNSPYAPNDTYLPGRSLDPKRITRMLEIAERSWSGEFKDETKKK
jgi:hypothetical protein